MRKPKITAINRIYDKSIVIFWESGAWKIMKTEILAGDNDNGNFKSVGITDKTCFRIRETKNINYIKLIFTREDGTIYITDPQKIEE